jgi:hypothetical protein
MPKLETVIFLLTDENKQYPVQVNFKRLNASITDFFTYGPDVSTSINKMSFRFTRIVCCKS